MVVIGSHSVAGICGNLCSKSGLNARIVSAVLWSCWRLGANCHITSTSPAGGIFHRCPTVGCGALLDIELVVICCHGDALKHMFAWGMSCSIEAVHISTTLQGLDYQLKFLLLLIGPVARPVWSVVVARIVMLFVGAKPHHG